MTAAPAVSASNQDTIVAVATAPGEGAIGIVRLSGPEAVSIASRQCPTRPPLEKLEDRRLTLCSFAIDQQPVDDVLVGVMRAPRSYTGEDTVELHAHGGRALIAQILGALESTGARQADPGEFTRRAFMNGKLDLTQAEAVMDLIQARTDISLKAAYFQLRGGQKDRFEHIRSTLRQALVLLEAQLDFSEDVDVDNRVLRGTLEEARQAITDQLHSYATGKRMREGARVALCGQPNVGKSSLLNALLQEERAIVTHVAGTTRDTIVESVNLDGVSVTLTDTAGLRATEDPIEREGNRRSELAISSADLILRVVDGHHPPDPVDLEFLEAHQDRSILVVNKEDLGVDSSWGESPHVQEVRISARGRTGLDELRSLVRARCLGEGNPVEAITHERHAVLLEQSCAAIQRAVQALSDEAPWEIVSLEVRESTSALDRILGETTPQDTLDSIFTSFCIGK